MRDTVVIVVRVGITVSLPLLAVYVGLGHTSFVEFFTILKGG